MFKSLGLFSIVAALAGCTATTGDPGLDKSYMGAGHCPESVVTTGVQCVELASNPDLSDVQYAFWDCTDEVLLEEQLLRSCDEDASQEHCADLKQLYDRVVPACMDAIGFPYGVILGPAAPKSGSEFAAAVESVDISDVDGLFDPDHNERFDGLSGWRSVSTAALTIELSRTLVAEPESADLIDEVPAWEDHLYFADSTTSSSQELAVDWSVAAVVELWRTGQVIGYVSENHGIVEPWDGADSPVFFVAYVFSTADGEEVRRLYNGPFNVESQ